ncbi:MAG TPA: hypothetical protein VEJ44_07000 [Acidimicrobiales bacterium]|nr:hypothetical protein [Acidimicrobiales bacterium]
MPVPLPDPGSVNLTPPDAAEVQTMACGIAAAVADGTGLTALQRTLIEALFPAMTGHTVDLRDCRPMTPHDLATALSRRDLQFRSRGVQVMLLCALVLRPLPDVVVGRVAEFARELGVDEGMVGIAHEFAQGSLGLAAFDFERNGYSATWHPDDVSALHTSTALVSPWDVSVTDDRLAERWSALEELPAGTLGRGVWELYLARGFTFPGTVGSAPPLLAQHDWVHVLADYGTTVESEVEVFGFIARANDDLRAFSLLAMVVSLFETGYLRSGAGLFESSPGHLSADPRLATRLSDAMRRGALCHDNVTGQDSIDFLRQDWFEVAHLPIDAVRHRFSLVGKSPAAVEAGSVGPWERGGISPFQLRTGRGLADRLGRAYDSYGAGP